MGLVVLHRAARFASHREPSRIRRGCNYTYSYSGASSGISTVERHDRSDQVMKLFVAGVSHKTAPVEVREQLAVTPSHLVDAAEVLKLFGHLDEVVLLSTCNRVEIYGTTGQATGHVKSLLQLLCDEPRVLD